MNNEQDKDEKEKDITDIIGLINSGASGAADEWIRNNQSNLPKRGGLVLTSHFWIISGMLLSHKIAKTENEREVFGEVYKFVLSAIGGVTGGFAGGKLGATLCAGDGLIEAATCGIIWAGVGSGVGSEAGSAYANHTSDKAFNFYQNTKKSINDSIYDFIQRIQSIGTTNPKLTLVDIKLAEALLNESLQKDSTQSNRQARISCLQPITPQPPPNLKNKNISKSFKDTISSKVNQSSKDKISNPNNQISNKGQPMNPNFLTLLIGDLAFNVSNTPNALNTSNTSNTTKQPHFIISKALINESLESPFSIECEGYIETLKDNLLDNQDLNPKNLINKPATFSIKNPNQLLNNRPNKAYSGILSNVKYLGFETMENTLNHRHFFSFKVESVLIKMSLNKANRIYIDSNVPEVIKETLNFYNDTFNKEIDFSNILLDYEKQELISQYQESDLDFITRIAHNCGIFFYETSDKIYFCDHYKKGTTHLIPYNSNPNNNLKQECIHTILQENQISANSFTHSSTHFSQPANISTSTANPNPNDALSNKHFYENAPISKVYENRFKMLDEILNAKSNIYELQLCDFLEIKNFREKESFVLVANTQILSNNINFQGCENVLTLLPSQVIYAPSPKVKPKAPHCTQGIVIGKGLEIEQERNTIYTDDYGRVKVRINLYAAQESIDAKQGIYHHTPFLRVASPIASHHSGFYHTPRVGDEVIISFLDEDIDKPYVSSSLYNGTTTMPQYNYPRYKREIASHTLSSLSVVPTMINKGLEELKLQEDTDYSLSPTNNHYLTLANATIGTDNVEARARNEITLKNDKDKEEIYILAQKDYKEEIGNTYEQTIKSNKTSEVGALYTE
ncbi:type VI secretion system Vgr family protein, partial [Helicobacter rodentium]|uniref:type VI secretion system Vgr family protein n=1 Tax=Helicobacter rodentium TaxID=59617 RepID=UPI0026165D17